jgi:hypothetical protein
VKLCQEAKLKIIDSKLSDFGALQLQKSERKNDRNCQISIFGFQCVGKNVEDNVPAPKSF